MSEVVKRKRIKCIRGAEEWRKRMMWRRKGRMNRRRSWERRRWRTGKKFRTKWRKTIS